MSWDLKVIETGSGGDLVNLGNDLAVTYSVATMIYLALFGGNVKQSTDQRTVNSHDLSWWGNRLLMKNEPSQQFNSLTERTLRLTELSPRGRNIIENAVKEDLKSLAKIFTIVVNVKLPGLDKVQIGIILTDLESSQETRLIINLKKSGNGDFSIDDFSVNDFYI